MKKHKVRGDKKHKRREDFSLDELVSVSWYTHEAFYLNGRLVYFGEGFSKRCGWGLFQALGYNCVRLEDIPICSPFPHELDRDEKTGWWKPPKWLKDLEKQLAAIRSREYTNRVESLREELKSLEASPPGSNGERKDRE